MKWCNFPATLYYLCRLFYAFIDNIKHSAWRLYIIILGLTLCNYSILYALLCLCWALRRIISSFLTVEHRGAQKETRKRKHHYSYLQFLRSIFSNEYSAPMARMKTNVSDLCSQLLVLYCNGYIATNCYIPSCRTMAKFPDNTGLNYLNIQSISYC